MEGNNEANRVADLGCLSSPLNPVSNTPSPLVSPHTPLQTPYKKARLSTTSQHDLSEVSRCITFSSPACVRFTSVTANDILRPLDIEPISESDESVSLSHSTDNSDSHTITLGSSSNSDSTYSTDVSDTEKSMQPVSCTSLLFVNLFISPLHTPAGATDTRTVRPKEYILLYVVGPPHGIHTHHEHRRVWLSSCSFDRI